MEEVRSKGQALATGQALPRGQALATGQILPRGQVPLSVQALMQVLRRQSKTQYLQAAKKSPPGQ